MDEMQRRQQKARRIVDTELTPKERVFAHALLILAGYSRKEADEIMVEVEGKFKQKMEERGA